ncbi:MAG: FAD-binding protein [Acidimicrobiia bacterium]|nr:FAD-binding protein [Acidimicrobiia bacterium]
MTGWLKALGNSPNMGARRPLVGENYESNVPGIFVIGDLSGAPVVKLAMEHGNHVAEHIASLADARATAAGAYDLIVIGAGAAGLNAALVAQERGLNVLVLEKAKVANTIEDFPEGKWVYAEPDTKPAKGKLWLDGAKKEDLLRRWHQIIEENHLEVYTEEGVTAVTRRKDGHFDVKTEKGVYTGRRVIVATGQRGNPRKLGVPGEEREHVYHRLYSPGHYHGEEILVVGGGNSAVEAAITLAGRNQVTLSYRGAEFSRIFKENERKLAEAVATGRVRLIYNSQVKAFGGTTYTLETPDGTRELPYQHAFVLIGAELPEAFLKSLGLKLENEWSGNPWLAAALTLAAMFGLAFYGGANWLGAAAALASVGGLLLLGLRGSRFAWLGFSFLICYTIYGAKMGENFEFWPYRGWGYKFFSFRDRPMSFWYTVSYTAVMTMFGIQAMKRWGFDRKDRFQIWRYTSLLGFQWIFFFLIPEFLFQYAVSYEWLGEIAKDPVFASQAWRSYGIVYAWPLFFYTFFGSPHEIWVVWGVLLSFVIVPVLVLWHGKRYCSWICGCGGLAETLGDRWRHNAPKGKASIRWEVMNSVVLAAAAVITVMMVSRDAVEIFRAPSGKSVEWYRLIVDVWLVGILPVTLYPFFGGKVWCRYWCPLAKMMQVFSSIYTRMKMSRFAIHSNEKCIACGECSRNCQVGIDVMNYARKQEVLDNATSSCIGCGICVTVCPMDVLSFQPQADPQLVQISKAA